MRISVFNWGENRYFKKERECIMLNYRCWFVFLVYVCRIFCFII